MKQFEKEMYHFEARLYNFGEDSLFWKIFPRMIPCTQEQNQSMKGECVFKGAKRFVLLFFVLCYTI
jgi:hypothetical protein